MVHIRLQWYKLRPIFFFACVWLDYVVAPGESWFEVESYKKFIHTLSEKKKKKRRKKGVNIVIELLGFIIQNPLEDKTNREQNYNLYL